jgi:hypothetical protein
MFNIIRYLIKTVSTGKFETETRAGQKVLTLIRIFEFLELSSDHVSAGAQNGTPFRQNTTTHEHQMARIGEGDERWIVKEREDGKNVGNWHWSETNCLRHAEDGLRERLVGLDLLQGSSLSPCEITALTKCEGDCYTYNRKGKMYLFHDLKITLTWKGWLPAQKQGYNTFVHICVQCFIFCSALCL